MSGCQVLVLVFGCRICLSLLELADSLEELSGITEELNGSNAELVGFKAELCAASVMELRTSSLNEDELLGISTTTWLEEAGVGGSVEELVSGAITPANGG